MFLDPLISIIQQNGWQNAEPEHLVEMFDEDTALAILEQFEAERDDERYNKFRHLFPDLADCPETDSRGVNLNGFWDYDKATCPFYIKVAATILGYLDANGDPLPGANMRTGF